MINSETEAGVRTTQLGGIVCFLETKSEYENQKRQELFEKLKMWRKEMKKSSLNVYH